MQAEVHPVVTIEILGQEYRVRSDGDPSRLHDVAAHVDGVLREVQRSTSDTQDAAILAALNIASDLLDLQARGPLVERERVQALIELIDSA